MKKLTREEGFARRPEDEREDGGIIRAPSRHQFTQIPNESLRDPRLSYRARGVLGRLLSNSVGYKMTANDLAREGREELKRKGIEAIREGRDAIRTALGELEDAGYIVVEKGQDERGRWYTKVMVYDEPQK